MTIMRTITACLRLHLALCATAMAKEIKPSSSVLITNANLFDGKSATIETWMSVLVEGNKNTKLAKTITAPSGATVIDAKGRTMTPGLIDRHVHLMWNLSPAGLFDGPSDYIAATTAINRKKACR